MTRIPQPSNRKIERQRTIIRTAPGAATEIARRLAARTGGSVSVYQSVISQWLRGRTTSALVAEEVARYVAELSHTRTRKNQRAKRS